MCFVYVFVSLFPAFTSESRRFGAAAPTRRKIEIGKCDTADPGDRNARPADLADREQDDDLDSDAAYLVAD